MFKAPRIPTLIAAVAATGFVATAIPAQAKLKPGEQMLEFKVKKQGDRRLYCVKLEPIVGSRIPEEICNDRDAWAKEGINIPAPASSANRDTKTQPGG